MPDSLDASVRDAVEKGDFALHFQPMFNGTGEDVTGLEAFLRWNVEGVGVQKAAAFLPDLERQPELMALVDQWVLETAVQQGREWLDRGYAFAKLFVNISTWTSADVLKRMVAEALEKGNFPAKLLVLECPWRLMAIGAEHVFSAMAGVKKLGCSFVLDGGPLDLECLGIMTGGPIKTLKICCQHLRELSAAEGPRSVSALIRAWERQGISVITMGVEDDEDSKLARSVGCRYVQGNGFKSPLSASDASSLLGLIKVAKTAFSF
ncbi:MAG: EAL domain-containing protein [Alphaproteobacteria bacterium]|nr:EAL domain-containing protein [Alphaproteobacteria bacterium]